LFKVQLHNASNSWLSCVTPFVLVKIVHYLYTKVPHSQGTDRHHLMIGGQVP